MKKFIYIISFILSTIIVKAQNTITKPVALQAEDVKVTVVGNNLEVVWVNKSTTEANYWEVQGSIDGKSYSTIGVVFGADPKGNGSSYHFKQTNRKIKPGFIYYRVLHIDNKERAVVSNSTWLTK